jgi:hypothetical protein
VIPRSLMRMPTAIFNLVSVWVNDYTPPTTGREIEKSRPLLAVRCPPELPGNSAMSSNHVAGHVAPSSIAHRESRRDDRSWRFSSRICLRDKHDADVDVSTDTGGALRATVTTARLTTRAERTSFQRDTRCRASLRKGEPLCI